ncbi:MAG: hypothetical protein ACI9MS_003801 [Glaciecola sp.]|jgi:hypothetical protein
MVSGNSKVVVPTKSMTVEAVNINSLEAVLNQRRLCMHINL